ncbi:MAG: ribbon-helix-helix protein, CopG family [Acidobacteriota bacterium]
MKSFTIHNLDDETAKLLDERARRENSSINRAVKRLLRSALGLDDRPPTDHRAEFMDLFGTWTDGEAATFDEAIRALRSVERDDW